MLIQHLMGAAIDQLTAAVHCIKELRKVCVKEWEKKLLSRL